MIVTAAFILGFFVCYAILATQVYFGVFLPMGSGTVPRAKLILSALAWPITIRFGDKP